MVKSVGGIIAVPGYFIDEELSRTALMHSRSGVEAQTLFELIIAFLETSPTAKTYFLRHTAHCNLGCFKPNISILTKLAAQTRLFFLTSRKSGRTIIVAYNEIKSNQHKKSDHEAMINNGIKQLENAGLNFAKIHYPIAIQTSEVSTTPSLPIVKSHHNIERIRSELNLLQHTSGRLNDIKKYITLLSENFGMTDNHQIPEEDLTNLFIRFLNHKSIKLWFAHEARLGCYVAYGESSVRHFIPLTVNKNEFLNYIIDAIQIAVKNNILSKERALKLFVDSASVNVDYIWSAIKELAVDSIESIDRALLNSLIEIFTPCVKPKNLVKFPLVFNNMPLIDPRNANIFLEYYSDNMLPLIPKIFACNVKPLIMKCHPEQLEPVMERLKGMHVAIKMHALIAWINENDSHEEAVNLFGRWLPKIHAECLYVSSQEFLEVRFKNKNLQQAFFSHFPKPIQAPLIAAPAKAILPRSTAIIAPSAPKITDALIASWQREYTRVMTSDYRNKETHLKNLFSTMSRHLVCSVDKQGNSQFETENTKEHFFYFIMQQSLLEVFETIIKVGKKEDIATIGKFLLKYNEILFRQLAFEVVFLAVVRADLDIVSLVISWGFPVNYLMSKGTDKGMSPLYASICTYAEGYLSEALLFDLVETLLNANADVDMPNEDGATPLHHACASSPLPVIRLLLERGANPNPLHHKIFFGHIIFPFDIVLGVRDSSVRALMQAFGAKSSIGAIPAHLQIADTDSIRCINEDQSYVTSNMTENLTYKLVSMILDVESSIEQIITTINTMKNNLYFSMNAALQGATVLHAVIYRMNPVISNSLDITLLRWLLENFEINLNVIFYGKDDICSKMTKHLGETSLQMASRLGLSEVVNLLLEHGAAPDFPNLRGNTFLYELLLRSNIENDYKREISELMYKFHCSTTHRNRKNKNLMQLLPSIYRAEMANFFANISLLPKEQFIINNIEVSNSGARFFETSVMIHSNHELVNAIHLGDENDFQKLLNELPRKVVMQMTQQGNSLLHFACLRRQYSMINLLLEYGLDVMALSSTKRTPLQLFASAHFLYTLSPVSNAFMQCRQNLETAISQRDPMLTNFNNEGIATRVLSIENNIGREHSL